MEQSAKEAWTLESETSSTQGVSVLPEIRWALVLGFQLRKVEMPERLLTVGLRMRRVHLMVHRWVENHPHRLFWSGVRVGFQSNQGIFVISGDQPVVEAGP